MLDKLKLNNLVISNKKLILKARVQTISKLVQKLRKTKTKSDSVKDKDRTRKYMECISELKTQKPVELMRQVLALSGGNTKSVLTNGRSTPKELSMAMLEENKIMIQLLEKFRQELKLANDKGNVAWREEILEMSKRRAKIERTEEKKRKRKELKEIKANDRKRLEWLKVNQQGPEGEEVTDNKEEPHDTKQQQLPIEVEKSSNVSTSEKSTKLKENPKTKATKPGSETKEHKNQKPMKPNERLKTKTNTPDTESKKPTPIKLKEKPMKNSAKERPTHVIDPFFITESGQPYLSTAIDNSDDEDDEKQPSLRQPEHPATATSNWRKQKYEKPMEKPTTIQREGKKIKFNDVGQATFASPAPAPTPASAPTVSTEGMHPSWIAKQKWKPKIAEFQGTKITFDD